MRHRRRDLNPPNWTICTKVTRATANIDELKQPEAFPKKLHKQHAQTLGDKDNDAREAT